MCILEDVFLDTRENLAHLLASMLQKLLNQF